MFSAPDRYEKVERGYHIRVIRNIAYELFGHAFLVLNSSVNPCVPSYERRWSQTKAQLAQNLDMYLV
jgi:hypothetical protein